MFFITKSFILKIFYIHIYFFSLRVCFGSCKELILCLKKSSVRWLVSGIFLKVVRIRLKDFQVEFCFDLPISSSSKATSDSKTFEMNFFFFRILSKIYLSMPSFSQYFPSKLEEDYWSLFWVWCVNSRTISSKFIDFFVNFSRLTSMKIGWLTNNIWNIPSTQQG